MNSPCPLSILSPSEQNTIRRSPEKASTMQSPPASEGNDSVIHHDDDEEFSKIQHDSPGRADETVGNLSTFSVDWSPGKQLRPLSILATPSTVKRPFNLQTRRSNDAETDPDATPRRPSSLSESPPDLLNFTGQTNIFIPPASAPRTQRRSPSGRGGFPIRVNPSPTHRSQASVDREAMRSAGTLSPNKQANSYFPPSTPSERHHPRASHGGLNLLDLDLEPQATPRSVPTITPRELESLRSTLEGQISILSARLSGKDAEVQALDKAMSDAQAKVGTVSEELRNERNLREALENEKEGQEKRMREMESILRDVRQEIMIGDREKEKLQKQVEEEQKRTEAVEVKLLENQAMLESSQDKNRSPATNGESATPGGSSHDEVDAAVKKATERVARELHALYKGKHETKVSALKKSYEARWERRVRELEENLKNAQDEIVELKTQRDSTMTGVVPEDANMKALKEEAEAEKTSLEAKVVGLEEEIAATRIDSDNLRADLERERAEKGELVAQVDLFLSMEMEPQRQPVQAPSSPAKSATNGTSDIPSAKKPRPMSMLKPPGKFSGIPGPGSRNPLARNGFADR